MSTMSAPGRSDAAGRGLDCPARHARVAGALALAHVVLMLVGLMLQAPPGLREGRAGIERAYAAGDLATILTGGYVEVLGFLFLVPVVVLLGSAVGGGEAGTSWLARIAAAAGLGYVAVTLSSGFAPGAAALWGVQHGLGPGTALVLNDVRNFAYFLSLALLGTHAACLGIACIRDRFGTAWVGWGGVLVGVVLIAAVPGAALGVQDHATLLWLAWWVGVAVRLLRAPTGLSNVAPSGAAVGHA